MSKASRRSATRAANDTVQRAWLWRRFSVRRIAHNPTRVAIVILSIALATALWSAVITVSLAGVQSFAEELGLSGRRFATLVEPVGGRFRKEEIAKCFAPISQYADMLFVQREVGVLRTAQRTKALSVAGVAGFGSSMALPGMAADNNGGGALSLKIRKELDLKRGDSVRLEVGGREVLFVLPSSAEDSIIGAGTDCVVPLGDLAVEPTIDTVFLEPRNAGKGDLVEIISASLRECVGASRPIRVETAKAPIERADKLLKAYRFNIFIMAAITLLVCGLLISQSTQVALRGMLRELSILRTLGVSRGECFALVVLEGALVSFLGAVLGYTVGYPLIVWLTSILLSTVSEIYHVELYSLMSGSGAALEALVRGFAVVVGMTLCGAIASACGARKVLSLAPYRGTRREQVHNAPLSMKGAMLLAVTSTCIAIVLLVLPRFIEKAALGYCAVMGAVLWGIASMPLALCLASSVPRVVRHFIPARLAAGALAIAGRHFLLSAVAACVAVSLMTGLSLMVASFQETLTAWSKTRLAGDLFVSSVLSSGGNDGRIEQSYVEEIRAIKDITRMVPYYETSSEVAGVAVVVGGTNIALQCERGVYSFRSGACVQRGGSWRARALISESAARKLRFASGSSLVVDREEFIVQGIVQEFGTEQPLVVIDEAQFVNLYPLHNPKTLTIDLASPLSVEPVRAKVSALAPEVLVIRDNSELQAVVDKLFKRTFRVTESVRWIVFTVALLGLVSTLIQYVWERRREFKTASVLGVSRASLATSIGIEAGCVTGAALLVGFVAGIAIGWCLTEYINPLVFGWSLAFSFDWMSVLEASAFLALCTTTSVLVAVRVLGSVNDSTRLADE